jgi:chorismate mutase
LLNKLQYCNTIEDKRHLELIRLREKADSIDMQLLELLHYRIEIIKQMSAYKRQHQIPILQLKRWRETVHSRIKRARELNMNPDFIKALLEVIHMEAIRIQSEEHSESKGNQE